MTDTTAATAAACPGRPVHRAWISIGANLGAARETVVAAIDHLRPLGLVGHSSLYCSAPHDAVGPDFINAVAALDTPSSPLELLMQLQSIEQQFGRQRPSRHAPRTLDLDLLLHGSTACSGEHLTLPHPRLQVRAFVLQPLLELAPDLQVPGLGPLAGWIDATRDQPIRRLDTLTPTMLPSRHRDS